MNLDVARPGLLVATLAAGGFGLAAGSTLVAAIIAQARGKGTLFAVLSFPVLLPLLLLAVELTRGAFAGGGAPGQGGLQGGLGGAGVALMQLLLYDGAVTTAGLMLFPVVWNP
jgi:heme exporter protein B